MKLASKILSLLLVLAMVFGLVACTSDTPDPSTTPSTAPNTESTEENYDGKLVSEGAMDIQYATQFTVELFKGGYRMINDQLSGGRILVVPEGMSVPTELDEDVQVLQLPVTNAYICGTNVAAMCDAIGAIDKVTLVGSDSTFYFDSINAQLDSGYTQFAGGYTTDPDYELIATSGTQVVVWNGYEEEVYNKFRELGIVVLCEENTNEPNLYARMEWWKCLGVLFGVEDQANVYFDDQYAQIEDIRANSETGIVVGMGAMSASSGKYYSRKSGDFQADYIRYAGGTYNLEDVEPGVGGSLSLTPEDYYLRFKDCDVLIWSFSGPTTMEELAELYPSIVDFKAYQNDQIYLQASKYIQTGALDPACIVRDIYTILTSEDPDVTTDHIVRLPWASDVAGE